MWFFNNRLGLERSLKFQFESVLEEVDENEKENFDKHMAELTDEKRKKFHIVVCDRWIETHCVYGDRCQSLHEYDLDKMKKCDFYEKQGKCSKLFCKYKHEDVKQRGQDCPYYVRGFCRHGSIKCNKRHHFDPSAGVCVNYLAGFCPDGNKCHFKHCKWVEEAQNQKNQQQVTTYA